MPQLPQLLSRQRRQVLDVGCGRIDFLLFCQHHLPGDVSLLSLLPSLHDSLDRIPSWQSCFSLSAGTARGNTCSCSLAAHCLLDWSGSCEQLIRNQIVGDVLQVRTDGLPFLQCSLCPLQCLPLVGMLLEVLLELLGVEGLNLELPSPIDLNRLLRQTGHDVLNSVAKPVSIGDLHRKWFHLPHATRPSLRHDDLGHELLLLIEGAEREGGAACSTSGAASHSVDIASNRSGDLCVDDGRYSLEIHTAGQGVLLVHVSLLFLLAALLLTLLLSLLRCEGFRCSCCSGFSSRIGSILL
mmetsp:Transcript_31520/g.67701  ORF Transcript_31520/g.67701 Transcript_31520/m.67701 type:complete len:297 (+) Transcript_31520:533-1423(+)